MPTHPPESQIAAYSPRFKALLALFLAAMCLLNGFVFWSARKQVVAGLPDYSIFYTAGLMLHRGQAKVLYNNFLQLQVQREFVAPPERRDGPLPYNHPPFEAVLFLPLVRLPFLISYALWGGVNLLLLASVVFLLRPHIPCLRSAFPWIPLLAALAFFPIAYALMQGQDSILLLAIY